MLGVRDAYRLANRPLRSPRHQYPSGTALEGQLKNGPYAGMLMERDQVGRTPGFTSRDPSLA